MLHYITDSLTHEIAFTGCDIDAIEEKQLNLLKVPASRTLATGVHSAERTTGRSEQRDRCHSCATWSQFFFVRFTLLMSCLRIRYTSEMCRVSGCPPESGSFSSGPVLSAYIRVISWDCTVMLAVICRWTRALDWRRICILRV